MKISFALIARLWVTGSTLSCLAQLPVVELTGFDSGGALSWTNRLCTTRPVYDVLRASVITGPWERIATVTDQTSITVDADLQGSGALFFWLAWADDDSLMLDYAFDEGYGDTAVVGQLNVALSGDGGMGFWSCQATPFTVDGLHPTGVGT